jgi:hypothetical protein
MLLGLGNDTVDSSTASLNEMAGDEEDLVQTINIQQKICDRLMPICSGGDEKIP